VALGRTAFRAEPVEHQHAGGETCPYCEQLIPNERAAEIRERFALKQRRDEAAMKAREDQRVAEVRFQVEAETKAKIDKMTADIAALQSLAREEGKKVAQAEASERIDQLLAAQQAGQIKYEESERLRLEANNQLKAQAAQTAALADARVAEARVAFEKAYAEKDNAKDALHAETMQKVSEELKELRNRLGEVEGEGADIKLYDLLKEQFPEDAITRINKTGGADIIHTVKYNKRECGKIVYDGRNRKIFKTEFATNLRKDMIAAKATHAILTTRKFLGGAKHVDICEGVIAANPALVAVLAQIFRSEIVRNFTQRVGAQDQARKTAKLYAFITSDDFGMTLESLEQNDEKMLKIDEDEKEQHKRVWGRRRTLVLESQRLHARVKVDVERIIGTVETE
jgi:hypothetical protein